MLASSISKVLKSTGSAVSSLGKYVEGLPLKEAVYPNTRVVKFGKKVPAIKGAFVASTASIIGDVSIGENSSIWYGAVIRGDINAIKLGEGVVVGDNSTIHVSGTVTHFPTNIGNNVYIGAGSIIHGCTLEDNSYVGEKAQVLDGAVIKPYAKVSAGSLVTKGTIVPSGQLWSGIPAVYVRELSTQEKSDIDEVIKLNKALATEHALEMGKSIDQIDLDELEWLEDKFRNPIHPLFNDKERLSKIVGEVKFHRFPGQLFDSEISAKNQPKDVLPLKIDP